MSVLWRDIICTCFSHKALPENIHKSLFNIKINIRYTYTLDKYLSTVLKLSGFDINLIRMGAFQLSPNNCNVKNKDQVCWISTRQMPHQN